MVADVLIIYLVTGIFVGLCSGLFGAGSGIISVPALLIVFLWQGYDEAYIMPCVVGTSLGIMFFTSLISI